MSKPDKTIPVARARQEKQAILDAVFKAIFGTEDVHMSLKAATAVAEHHNLLKDLSAAVKEEDRSLLIVRSGEFLPHMRHAGHLKEKPEEGKTATPRFQVVRPPRAVKPSVSYTDVLKWVKDSAEEEFTCHMLSEAFSIPAIPASSALSYLYKRGILSRTEIKKRTGSDPKFAYRVKAPKLLEAGGSR